MYFAKFLLPFLFPLSETNIDILILSDASFFRTQVATSFSVIRLWTMSLSAREITRFSTSISSPTFWVWRFWLICCWVMTKYILRIKCTVCNALSKLRLNIHKSKNRVIKFPLVFILYSLRIRTPIYVWWK